VKARTAYVSEEAVGELARQEAHVHCVIGSDDPTPMASTFSGEWALAESLGANMGFLERDIERRWQQLPGAG
jgi:hypothetical protein